MKCPHCDYEDGWVPDKLDIVKGKDGEFFELSNEMTMQRDSKSYYGYVNDTRRLIGCPSCNKLFMSPQ
jgi:uncharacterized C2H2 Zn-finger protein